MTFAIVYKNTFGGNFIAQFILGIYAKQKKKAYSKISQKYLYNTCENNLETRDDNVDVMFMLKYSIGILCYKLYMS